MKRSRSENDRLRVQVLELQSTVDALEMQNRELKAKLQLNDSAAEDGSEAPGSDEILANTPHISRITIGRLSFASDSDGDGVLDLITLYVQPEDGRGRFHQLVGSVTATAALVPVQGEAKTIGQIQLTPSQVRDAYRSSLTGTHYTIELPIQMAQSSPDDSMPKSEHASAPDSKSGQHSAAFVRVMYTDGLTGQSFTAERSIRLN